MNRFFKVLTPVLTAAVLVFSAGCSMLKNETPAENQKTVASALGEKLLLCFLKNDPAGFVKMLPGDAGEQFTETDFKRTRETMIKQLGEPVSYCFVSNLEHPIARVSVWRIRFERKSTDGTRVIPQEVLFKVVSTKHDPETLGAWNFL